MAKPIGVLYIPEFYLYKNGDKNYSVITTYRADCLHHFPDYHWLVLPDPETQKTYLQVFHEKDFTEIQHAELLQLINDKLDHANKTR